MTPNNAFVRSTGLAVALLAVALLVGACSSSGSPAPYGGGAYGAGHGGTPPAVAGVVVSVATTSLGPVLAGPTGNTLYIHAGDSATSSACTGSCLAAWPALTVSGSGHASGGTGVTGTFASFTRTDDGATQVTYNGMPLYYWQSDTKAGDATGQGIAGFTVAKP